MPWPQPIHFMVCKARIAPALSPRIAQLSQGRKRWQLWGGTDFFGLLQDCYAMLRRWAHGLLAFIFCLTLVEGRSSSARADGWASAAATHDTVVISLEDGLPSAFEKFRSVDPRAPRVETEVKRGREGGPGDGPIGVALVAFFLFIAAFSAGPFRASRPSPVVWLRPANRPQAAGRCPTGPPALPA